LRDLSKEILPKYYVLHPNPSPFYYLRKVMEIFKNSRKRDFSGKTSNFGPRNTRKRREIRKGECASCIYPRLDVINSAYSLGISGAGKGRCPQHDLVILGGRMGIRGEDYSGGVSPNVVKGAHG